jgi:bacillithiol biosynthesis deacetylase BshB1
LTTDLTDLTDKNQVSTDCVDLLAFGPHPDDIEIGFGGSVAVHVAQGLRVGLVDLTRGELGSNGTPEQREAEGEAAREVLGAAWRKNLRWPDGAITGSEAQILDVARLIRAARPKTVVLPYRGDRHPDHVAASDVLTRGAFNSALRRFDPSTAPWRPDWTCYYFINDSIEASFAIDVSARYDTKRTALACHASQFAPSQSDSVPTRLTASTFMQLIESRDAQLGARTGVAYAEGLVVRDPLLRANALKKG